MNEKREETKEVSRRDFLANGAIACAAFAGAMALLESCKTLGYTPSTFEHGKLVVKKSDVAGKKYVVVRMEKLSTPIYVSQANGKYSAVLMQCTHKQCELSTYGKVLHCPCHGSEFDQQGRVLQGPASKGLTRFTVSQDEKNIYIQ